MRVSQKQRAHVRGAGDEIDELDARVPGVAVRGHGAGPVRLAEILLAVEVRVRPHPLLKPLVLADLVDLARGISRGELVADQRCEGLAEDVVARAHVDAGVVDLLKVIGEVLAIVPAARVLVLDECHVAGVGLRAAELAPEPLELRGRHPAAVVDGVHAPARAPMLPQLEAVESDVEVVAEAPGAVQRPVGPLPLVKAVYRTRLRWLSGTRVQPSCHVVAPACRV